MKKTIRLLTTSIAMCCMIMYAFAQDKPYDVLEGADVYVYKTVGSFDLKLNVVKPTDGSNKKKNPTIVFFFGGGWRGGSGQQCAPHCDYFASKGMVAIAVNYRVASRNNSTPFDAVEDAKSAMRWIRENAKELGVHKKRIVAAGGSAGGHLAATTALLEGFDSEGEKQKEPAMPNALILFNPVINTMPEGYGYDRLKERAESLSPAHHVRPGLPPTLIFHGTADNTVPYANIIDFQEKMEAAGNKCEVMTFEDEGHGFFNYGRKENKYYELTTKRATAFLQELGYIK